ncbi:hypothetical protein QUF50_07385 [Thiotrichales bacterium HSG1]|nr:hypothetical protein [Thiotrichales bacterium HSG1]
MNDNNDLSLRLKTAECEQEQLLEDLLDIQTSLSLINEESTQKRIAEELSEIKNKITQLQQPLEDSCFQTTEKLDADSETYVVCLTFTKHSPPEWYENRWRISGKGKSYSTPEQAYQCLQQLKQRWPDYPIEIFKKIIFIKLPTNLFNWRILMFDSEIEERLNELELEQDKQVDILEKFDGFENEIQQLESTLKQIDQFYLQKKQDTDFSKLRNLKKTEELEKELADMTAFSETPNIKVKENVIKTNSTSYVIRLMNNPKLPKEWSGNEWCVRGKGMRYKTPEQVKQTFKALKKKFPNQIMKVFKI